MRESRKALFLFVPKTSLMNEQQASDNGFLSGPWSGFWQQPDTRGFHRMEVDLSFKAGRVTGAGKDEVGSFAIRGGYDRETGACWWDKCYRTHTIAYEGIQQSEVISGQWSQRPGPSWWSGPFRLWPKGNSALAEEFFLSCEEPAEADVYQPVELPMASRSDTVSSP